jgi:uncharacterized phage-like protein YoqJ
MLKVALFSGYKPNELGIYNEKHQGVKIIKKVLKRKIYDLLDQGLEWVLISGQPGVELWTAECVLDIKLENTDIKLGIVTPFLNQEERWKDELKERYHTILASADYVDSVSKKPYESPSQFRVKNQFLISKSDCLVILYDEDKAGTPDYYLSEAVKRKNKEEYQIFTITPYDIQSTIEDEQENDPNYWAQ